MLFQLKWLLNGYRSCNRFRIPIHNRKSEGIGKWIACRRSNKRGNCNFGRMGRWQYPDHQLTFLQYCFRLTYRGLHLKLRFQAQQRPPRQLNLLQHWMVFEHLLLHVLKLEPAAHLNGEVMCMVHIMQRNGIVCPRQRKQTSTCWSRSVICCIHIDCFVLQRYIAVFAISHYFVVIVWKYRFSTSN